MSYNDCDKIAVEYAEMIGYDPTKPTPQRWVDGNGKIRGFIKNLAGAVFIIGFAYGMYWLLVLMAVGFGVY